jgi:hypothetical protein
MRFVVFSHGLGLSMGSFAGLALQFRVVCEAKGGRALEVLVYDGCAPCIVSALTTKSEIVDHYLVSRCATVLLDLCPSLKRAMDLICFC